MAAIVSKRIRAGLYEVTTDTGRTFTVEQIRTDTPGYGVERRWWVNPSDDGPHPVFDPFATKGDALDAITLMFSSDKSWM